MRLKKAWMLATIMTLCGTMMTMSSCKKDDDPSVVPIPELTPEEQLKADTYERIKFLREDPALQELGIGRMFLFQEDDTYECATFYQADTNGDGKMDEDESVMMVSNGMWKPLGKVNCSLVNQSFDALAVDYVIKSVVELPSSNVVLEPIQEQYKDTLYIIPNPAGGDNFLFQSDLVTLWMLSNQEELSASTRWDLSDIWNAATEILKQVIKDVIPGVWEFWKWTKATFADSYDPVVTGNSNWMGNIFKDLNPKIHEISIPGTHDTFTYGLTKVTSPWGMTQVFNLEEQFDAGVRYFDFRLGIPFHHSTRLDFYHGLINCNVELIPVMDKLRELLKYHPGETVIAMLKFEDADTDQTRVDLLREVLDKYKDILVDPSKYGPELRLNDCRGKIILMQRFKESGKGYTNASFGIYCGGDDRNQVYENRYGDITWKVMEQDVCECVINPLHPKDDMDKFMKDRKELFEANLLDCNTEHADRPDTWHINKTSGYLKALGGLGMSYAVSANTMNQFANNTIRGRMGQKTGWIVMDFAGLDIEGSMRVNVYGDVLIQALIDNNRAMVNKGVLK